MTFTTTPFSGEYHRNYASITFLSDTKSAPCTVSEQTGKKPEDSASNVDTGYDTNSIASSSQIPKVPATLHGRNDGHVLHFEFLGYSVSAFT